MSTLVIVPCAAQKIWRSQPDAGPTPASHAYTSPVFKVNRAYAQAIGDTWLILSAKYGFLWPDTPITNYDVTFSRLATHPVDGSHLAAQARTLNLAQYDTAVILGGSAYRARAQVALRHVAPQLRLQFPFAGYELGHAMQQTKLATVQHLSDLSPDIGHLSPYAATVPFSSIEGDDYLYEGS